MACRERRDAHDMHVIVDSLRGGLVGRREERPDVDLESEIRKGRGDDFLAAVVTVLPDLGDEDARLAAFVLRKGARHALHALDRARAGLLAVDARDGLHIRAVAAENLLERVRDLADRRLGARGLDRQSQQIAATRRAVRQRLKRLRDRRRIAFGAQPPQLLDLLLAHG